MSDVFEYTVTIDIEPGDFAFQHVVVTPSTETQYPGHDREYDRIGSVTVEPIPSEYIIPDGVLDIDENGIYDVHDYAKIHVDVNSGVSLRKFIQEGYEHVTDDTVTRIGAPFLAYDQMLQSITLSQCDIIFDTHNENGRPYAFQGCTRLQSVNMPALRIVGAGAFYESGVQQAVITPSQIGSMAFANSNLMTLDLRGCGSVPSLLDADAFDNTPIADGKGQIMVKSSLVNSFKSATNWSRFASVIKGG